MNISFFSPSGASAECREHVLLREVQLGRSEPKRRGGASQEVHPRAACSAAHVRVPQHLQLRQRSVMGYFIQLKLQ